jgi:hypothetical protein
MEGGFKKKALGFVGQVLVVATGVIAGILILEIARKPRIAPPTSTPPPAQA